MIKYAVAVAAVIGICSAIPAGAEDVGVGVGPRGVTVGEVHGDRDRDRDRDHYRDRDRRGRDETVIIKKDRDHDYDRDRNHDRRPDRD
jgi:hypothetical protein